MRVDETTRPNDSDSLPQGSRPVFPFPLTLPRLTLVETLAHPRSTSMNRRDFLATSTVAATLPAAFAASRAAKLRVGLIGCGWYGKCDLLRLRQIAPVEFVSLCDVDQKMLADAADIFARTQNGKKP